MVCSFAFRASFFAAIVSLLAATPTTASLRAQTPSPAACNQDASVTSAVTPRFPASARNLRGRVIVLVEVVIGATGSVKEATIYKSSGDTAVDAEALRAARASVYAPKTVKCVPTDANYLFREEFVGTPLTPPTIAVPPGWKPGPFNQSTYETRSWSDDTQHQLILRWQKDSQTIDQIRASELNARAGLRAQRAVDVRLCDGTQSGVRFFHEAADSLDHIPSGEVEVIVTNGVLYTASFLAYDHSPPSEDVRKALDSFCAPASGVR